MDKKALEAFLKSIKPLDEMKADIERDVKNLTTKELDLLSPLLGQVRNLDKNMSFDGVIAEMNKVKDKLNADNNN
jgi:hypothetical protein